MIALNALNNDMNELRKWVRLVEAGLPNDFVFSNWGYWIEPDGKFVPVARHSHHTVYYIGDHVFAEGRIRVTAVTDPSTVKMDNPIRLLTANFNTNYVTKAALRALTALVTEYEFDEYTIIGMTIDAAQLGNYNRDPDAHIDPRSVQAISNRTKALGCLRVFGATAGQAPPPKQDKKLVEPENTFGKRRKR